MLVDAHCHLDWKDFEKDLDEIVGRAKEKGVVVVTNGVNHQSNVKTLEISKKYDNVKAALGAYPRDLVEMSEEDFEKELEFIEKHKDDIIAIGEVGLDLKEIKDIKLQKERFDKIIELAKKIDKPLIVHSRKAEVECIESLERLNAKKVMMHCFSGKLKLVNKIEENNWYISIPTNIVRSEHFQKIVEIVNINQLLTETDAPFLSPYKDKRNEPIFVEETLKVIAKIKNISVEETKKNIFMNFQKLFL